MVHLLRDGEGGRFGVGLDLAIGRWTRVHFIMTEGSIVRSVERRGSLRSLTSARRYWRARRDDDPRVPSSVVRVTKSLFATSFELPQRRQDVISDGGFLPPTCSCLREREGGGDR